MKKIVLTLVASFVGTSFLATSVYAIPATPITVQYWTPQSVEVLPYGSTWFEISAFDGDDPLLVDPFWDDLEFSWIATKGKLVNQTNWFEGPNLYKSKILWSDMSGIVCTWADIIVTVDDIDGVPGFTWTNDSPTSRTFKAHVTPAPGAFLLGSIGLSFSGWLLRRRRML